MAKDAAQSGAEFWRRNARRYDRVTLLLNRRFAEIGSLAAEDLRGCRRVVEIAAGTGLVTERLAADVAELVATDRSPEMLAILTERIAARGLGNVTVQEADAVSLPFPDDAFDGAVAANVLHLLADPEAAIRELTRVVRDGGVVCAPTFAHGETLLAGAVSRLLSVAGFRVRSRFRGSELRQLLTASGCSVVREALVPGVLPLQYVAIRVSKKPPQAGAPRPRAE